MTLLAKWKSLAEVENARMLENCDPPLRSGTFVSRERLNEARDRKMKVKEMRERGLSIRQIEMRLAASNATIRRDLVEMRE